MVHELFCTPGGQQGEDRSQSGFVVGPAGEAPREIQQCVAVGPALLNQSSICTQEGFEGSNVAGLQSMEGRHERFGSGRVRARCRGQQIHPADEVVPGLEAMLPCVD